MIVPTMQVEIDLFSGRPNPTWELTAAEVSELKARLATPYRFARRYARGIGLSRFAYRSAAWAARY